MLLGLKMDFDFSAMDCLRVEKENKYPISNYIKIHFAFTLSAILPQCFIHIIHHQENHNLFDIMLY